MALTHAYHRYPAKFIPQIVKKLIDEYARKGTEVICDPFGGCGTTLVEAKLHGLKSVGFDINPVAKLITEVKITPIEPKILENGKEEFLKFYEAATPHPSDQERHERIKYWFDEATVRELDKIYHAIRKITDDDVRRFFLCAFSHNLKNCSRWLMKSIKPTIDKNKFIPVPLESFLRHLNTMMSRNGRFYSELAYRPEVSTDMHLQDVTKEIPLESNSIDLIVTSPPYVTSYEYADLHQLSLIWFGEDPELFEDWNRISSEFADFRRSFIGTSLKREARAVPNDVSKEKFNSVTAEATVNDLLQVNRPLATDVANYFLDMKMVFAEMHRVLKPGGKACIIIGDTKLRGVEILNAEVAAEQMLQAGFKKRYVHKARSTE